MVDLFGWLFRKKEEPVVPSFSPKDHDDGSVQVAPGGVFGTYVDLDGGIRNDAELITRYRQMSEHPELDSAIEEVIGEMIAQDYPVKIILDDVKQSNTVLKAISDTFEEVVELLDFRRAGYKITRQWYIDGRMYFHVMIDPANTKDGVQELRYVDPRKIRKVREIIKKPVRGGALNSGDAVLTITKNEYFIYNDKGFGRPVQPGTVTSSSTTAGGIKIAKDAIVYITSGLVDAPGAVVLSHLHKAIKPLNQLRCLEDAAIIYRLSRSPERRIWYIDVGNLPKMKAEQYIESMMHKHRNKLNYDASDGTIRNERRFMTMLEDYWLPQRDGKGTKVDVLPPGAAFNQIDDILFFQKKLYASLHVPVRRLDPENGFQDGDPTTATQISSEEVKFGKFIERLRVQFASLFVKVLEKQIVLKQIMTLEDYQKISPYFRFDFVKDNYFMETQEQKILQNRINLVMAMAPMVGRYWSNQYIRREILKQSEEEIREMDEQICEESMMDQYATPLGGDPNAAPGEEDDPGNPAVIADQGAIEAPPNQAKPEKEEKPKKKAKSKANGKVPDFKSVANLLAKDT